jgi:hypothetical protein
MAARIQDIFAIPEGVRTQPPPFDRSYWIVPGLLLAGFYPGDREPAKRNEKLGILLDAGIRHVVNLLEEDEIDFCKRRFEPYDEALTALARERGLEVTVGRFPIDDMNVPDRSRMKAILDDIDGSLALGKPVYLHCWGGLGRTGTVAGCWLARHGITRKKATLKKLDELRNNAANGDLDSPQTATQRRMVVEWRKGE